MRLQTTTIGSYPKPERAPGVNSFDFRRGRWSATWTEAEFVATMTDDAQAAFDRAVAEVVAEQAEIGIDVVTDGEIRREHYIYYHCRHLRPARPVV
jgi:5-methyltetrahydropteroyltriglutamate--homocysteine methyltransferase